MLKLKGWANKLARKRAGIAEGKVAEASKNETTGGVCPCETFDEKAKNTSNLVFSQ